MTYHSYIYQSNSVVGQSTMNTTVVRSVSKLAAAFITFDKTGLRGSSAEVHKEYHRFYHPMSRITFANSGIYDNDLDLEFQLQLGSKRFPEYPCKGITQAFYSFRKALNLSLFHQHHLSIECNQYKSNKFIFALSMERVPDSSHSGINTKSGQQLLIRCKPSGHRLTALMPDTSYTTLVLEQT